MSVGKLSIKHIFGVNSRTKMCMSFIDEHMLAYASGHQTVILNTETKEQSFIAGASQPHVSLGITAIAVCLPKKFIAIAEKAEPVGGVIFYDTQTFRRKKILMCNELGSKEVKCIAFSEDGRFFLMQGGAPEWNLVLWNVEKTAKIIASVKISLTEDACVHQVSFCPMDPNVIVVFGKSIAKLFRLVDGQLRPASLSLRRDHANFLTHIWLSEDKLLVGTEGGEILLIDNLEFRAVVYPSGAEGEEITPILCFAQTSNGFVCGTTEGEIRFFERQEDIKEQYQFDSNFQIKSKGSVVSLAMGNDESLVCMTDNQQLFQFSHSHSAKDSANGEGFDFLLAPFHGPNAKGEAMITGIDCALWRPLVVTAGRDQTIRVWSLPDKRIEIMKEFDDEPTSVSIHPSGLYVVAGFSEKIRMLSILLDDMYVCREFNVRNCSLVKFSKGGQYFAAVSGTNIYIFNSYTGAQIGVMRGHTGRPKSLHFCKLDSVLISIGTEGNVFLWDVVGCSRKPEQYVGILPFVNGVSTGDGSKIVCSTNEKAIKEIVFPGKNSQYAGLEETQLTGNNNGMGKELRDVNIGRVASCLVYNDARQVLLLGTSDEDRPGTIISMLSTSYASTVFDTADIHSAYITAMALSSDGTMLISGDANGCLIISEFEGVSQTAKSRESSTAFELIEEVLLHRSDLEARKAKIAELTARVEELNLNNEHQMRLKEMDHKDKVNEISIKYTVQLQVEREKFGDVFKEKSDAEKEYKSSIEGMEQKQKDEIEAVNSKYKGKLNNEAARLKQLMNETEEMHSRWNDENKALVDVHQNYLKQLTGEYEDKFKVEHQSQLRIQSDKDKMQIEYESQRGDIDLDADAEVHEMKAKYELRLANEESLGTELMSQHATMKRNLHLLNKDSDQQKEEIKRLKDKETRLLETIRALEKEIQSHKKEIREREETITDKEKRIFDLRKKNQELEKFRFVLDYKIKELKLQIAPRENDIATMNKQIEEMEMELDQYRKSNQSLNLMISELKLKLDGLRHELEVQQKRIGDNESILDKLQRSTLEAYEVINNYAALKAKIIELYRIYVQESGSRADSKKKAGAEDLQEIYSRDREQMERNLDALRRGLKTDTVAHRRDLTKMMRENVMLTKELNELRKDAKAMELQKAAVENTQLGPKTDLTMLMDMLGIKIKTSSGTNEKKKSRSGSPSDNSDVLPVSPPPGTRGSKGIVTRSAALRTTSASGKLEVGTASRSRNDQWEAWREIQMQSDKMSQLETHIRALCTSLNMDAENMLQKIDINLVCDQI